MRHEQHAAGECQQGLFQESQRGVVEVVGRFVQDQEVGALGELPAQPQLEPLPAAEPAYRRLRVELGHAPAAQHLGLPPDRGGGQPLQGRAVGGRCFRVVRSRRQPRGGRRHLLLQAGGSAEELAHRARCTAVRALVEVADGEIGRVQLMLPARCGCRPWNVSSRVDLPLPLAPIKAARRPAGTEKVTSRSRSWAPREMVRLDTVSKIPPRTTNNERGAPTCDAPLPHPAAHPCLRP